MNERTDQELLREYLSKKSDTAFAELVRRHLDLVYSVAWRILEDADQARDVAQSVFVAAVQQAPALASRVSVAGWLYTTARNLAARHIRAETRRRAREREAAAMNDFDCNDMTSDAAWTMVAPHLDAALEELPGKDREALLLRFFHNQGLRSVGARLGISDDAAQKRISRALERLRLILERRGIRVGTTGLVAAITSCGIQAAPAGLALSICTAATLSGTAFSATSTLAMTALQKTIIGGSIALLATAGIYEFRENVRLDRSVQTSSRAEATMRRRVEDLESELEQVRRRETALLAENSRLRDASTPAELLALRSEVSRLRSSASKAVENAEAMDLMARVERLKQHLQQNPAEDIPELQLATQKDWLAAAEANLESEVDLRKAMAALRSAAKGRFANVAAEALKRFCADHEGRHPESLHEIQPYLTTRVASSALDRYEILPQTAVIDIQLGSEKIVAEKTPIDEEFDSRIYFSSTGSHGASTFRQDPLIRLVPMIKAFQRENGAREPASLDELLPYAQTAEQRTTIETLNAALAAYKRDNNGAEPAGFDALKPYMSSDHQRP